MSKSPTTKRFLLWIWHVFNFGWVFRYENGKFTGKSNHHIQALKERRHGD